ncbi:MAG: 50S ribosomal protein L9 [bacterium]|nr:50S ribosomal protein L9 [bacterium]
MQVILVKDIKDVGRLGDRISVKTGYARNFLFPNRMALPATDANLKRFEDLSRKELKKRAEEKAVSEEKAKGFDGKSISVSVQTHKGRLYGSFTPNDFIRLAQDELGLELTKRQLNMPDHIKETGQYKVEVILHHDVSATINLTISSDSEVAAPTSFDETEEGEQTAAEKAAKKDALDKARKAAAEAKAKAEEEAAQQVEEDESDEEASSKESAEADSETAA